MLFTNHKSWIITAVILMIAVCSFAQTTSELEAQFKSSSKSEEKAEIASELSWELRDSDPGKSYYYAKEALKFSRKSGDQKIEAYSLADIGNYFKRKENYKAALGYYQKSLAVRRGYGDRKDIISIHNQIGLLYRQQEKYDSAAYYFSEGLTLIPGNGFEDLKMKILDGLGMSQFHLGDYKTALHNIDRSRVLAEKLEDSLAIAHSWQNRGTINQYLGYSALALKEYQKAEEFFRSTGNVNGIIDCEINSASIYLIQGRYDSAEKLLLEALEQTLENNFNDNRSVIYLNLGVLYDESGNPKAQEYFLKAFKYGEESNKVETRIEGALGVVSYLLEHGKAREADSYLTLLEDLILKERRTKYYADYYYIKSDYAQLNGNFEEAYMYSQKSIRLRDSIYAETGIARDLQVSLQIADQEKKALSEELKRKEAESNVNRLLFWIAIIVIVFLLIVVLVIRKNQRIRREVKIRELKFEAEISGILYQSELKYLEGNLELRKKIGRDLHDHLGSKLAVAQMRIDTLSRDETNAKKELEEISALLEQSCTDLRTISHDLVNQTLEDGTLNQAIKVLCDSMPQNDKFQIYFEPIGNTYAVEILVKRNLVATISLLIGNIVKHSGATEVRLQIFYHEDELNVELEDNGNGFDTVKKSNGIGLKNAKERIHSIRGTIEISSASGKGTSISISIPQ